MQAEKILLLAQKKLRGKTVAITGSTGGLGEEICEYLASFSANLILIDRNITKSSDLRNRLLQKYPQISVNTVTADLSSLESVRLALTKLKKFSIDVLILNAGAYAVPKCITKDGFDNVFQINFLSHYLLVKELFLSLTKSSGRVVAVGSIAHRYSKIRTEDFDFKNEKSCAKTYGNSKRFLMFALNELFAEKTNVRFSLCHPGITFTGITNHYPKWIFAIIKNPMKWIFMPPKKAALSIIAGCIFNTEYHNWIGPMFFDVWGNPKIKRLHSCKKKESKEIFKISETLL